MSQERIYRCNLCGDYIEPSDSGKLGFGSNVKAGYGIYFMAVTGKPVFKRPHETEHHICNVCAHGVHDELRKVMPSADGEPVRVVLYQASKLWPRTKSG